MANTVEQARLDIIGRQAIAGHYQGEIIELLSDIREHAAYPFGSARDAGVFAEYTDALKFYGRAAWRNAQRIPTFSPGDKVCVKLAHCSVAGVAVRCWQLGTSIPSAMGTLADRMPQEYVRVRFSPSEQLCTGAEFISYPVTQVRAEVNS